MKTLKVLFISHEDPGIGGAPKALAEMIWNLRKFYNVKPIVATFSKDKIYDFCKNKKIKVYVVHHRMTDLGAKKNFFNYFKYPFKKVRQRFDDKRAFHYLNKRIDWDKIDIVHSNVSVIGLGMTIKKYHDIPHIVHLRESPWILSRDLFSYNNYIKYLEKYTNKFFAISKYTKKGWSKAGLPENKIKLVYDGVSLPTKKKHLILTKRTIKMVIVGSIQESKGQITVIKAINKLNTDYKKRISLDIIGVGDKKEIKKIEKFIKINKLSNIHFLGYRDNVYELLDNYDIGIMASPAEAFGRTTIEYMATGLGIIGANGGATPEFIKNKRTGLLFKPKDSQSLMQAIQQLFLNPKLIRKCAHNAQEMAYQHFTSQRNVKDVFEQYLKIIKDN